MSGEKSGQKGENLILHAWTCDEVLMLEHHSTGLKFCCVEREPTPDDKDPWDCYILHHQSDKNVIQAEAIQAGMMPEAYVEYLAQTSMELADKQMAELRRLRR